MGLCNIETVEESMNQPLNVSEELVDYGVDSLTLLGHGRAELIAVL
jgi:aryl carrier-like protein